jgi:threonine dehydratase
MEAGKPSDEAAGSWPISLQDVFDARRRIRPHIPPTPLRRYASLDDAVGRGIAVWVKHENHNPTNAFKARNALSAMTLLSSEEKRRGVIGATRGNHGLGVAWAATLLEIPATICVPLGNNPEKNEAMRGYGARLVEEGRDYDESAAVAARLAEEGGLTTIHSTNNRHVIAGAATLTLEMLEERPDLEALVVSVGGGSQAVGAMTVAREMAPHLKTFAVQAARASSTYDSWRAGHPVTGTSADTFADGLATRNAYEMTFPALRAGLAGFVLVTEEEMAEAVRLLLRTTHNLAEGAGAAGLAGLMKLREELPGKGVGIILSGGNIDRETLRRVVSGEI